MILWTRKNVAQSKNSGEVCERINVYNEKVLLFFFVPYIDMQLCLTWFHISFTWNSHEIFHVLLWISLHRKYSWSLKFSWSLSENLKKNFTGISCEAQLAVRNLKLWNYLTRKVYSFYIYHKTDIINIFHGNIFKH